MKLSKILIDIPMKSGWRIIRDGEFDSLEQCSNIRCDNALTYLEKSKFSDLLQNRKISCVIVRPEFRDFVPEHITGIIETEYPKSVFFHLNNLLAARRTEQETWIDPTAVISPLAQIAPHDVRIGAHTVIGPFTVIRPNTVIGNGVSIQESVVVGGQSFTVIKENGHSFLAIDAGKTVIEDNVEICACSHIACGLLGMEVTRLKESCKIDAQVHIGHGAVIGKNTIITAGSVIGGNSEIGEDVWVGINATVSNRIVVGDRARISLGSVVTKNVPDGETVTGNFAINHKRFIENLKMSANDGQKCGGGGTPKFMS